MQSTSSSRVPSPAAAPDREIAKPLAIAEANRDPDDVPRKPFVERRRRRAIEGSWQEALDCLHRVVLGYEKANEQLKAEEDKYRSIFEEALVGLFRVDAEGRPLNINRAMACILGYESSEEFLACVSSDVAPLLILPGCWQDWTASIEEAGVRCGIEVQVRCRNGESRWIRVNVRTAREGERILYYEGTAEDITDRKHTEIRNQRLAYYDSLTGLPNRRLFNQRLEEVVVAAKWSDRRAALLLLKIDRFKMINDSLGDQIGDHLLKEVTERIATGVGEKGLVARVAGTEFAIILPHIEDVREAGAAAENVVTRLNTEFSFLGHSLSVFCHVGISLFPDDGRDAEALMKCADVALCSAREEGANNFRFFTEEMNSQMLDQLRLENGLRVALARNELFLVYQPQVDIRTGAVVGLEALLRWQHPELGLVPPTRFIGVAENSGLIVPIGEWVLRTACAQARKWQDQGLPPVPVAVNVSAIQFRRQGFRELIRQILQETGLEPKYLELELTESVLLNNADVMFSIIEELRALGVMLAIDDFGTGYSSLGYLRQFKVNRLKIARSFVQDVPVNADDVAITTAIINMAKALNLAVLAEGVENEAQLSFLRAQQCYTIQGFYFSRPVEVEEIVERLRSGFIQQDKIAVE